MIFIVKNCDPITGEVQDDGYQEDYRVCSKNKINLLLITWGLIND